MWQTKGTRDLKALSVFCNCFTFTSLSLSVFLLGRELSVCNHYLLEEGPQEIRNCRKFR